MHDEPIIALDGDTAGFRAALRVIDLALPLLEAGKSLRFCLMPQGMDPDDLIRAEGRGAMQRQLENSVPLVQLLWRRETEGKTFDSPNAKQRSIKACARRSNWCAIPRSAVTTVTRSTASAALFSMGPAHAQQAGFNRAGVATNRPHNPCRKQRPAPSPQQALPSKSS